MALESLILQPDDRVIMGLWRAAPRELEAGGLLGLAAQAYQVLIGGDAVHTGGRGIVRDRGGVAQAQKISPSSCARRGKGEQSDPVTRSNNTAVGAPFDALLDLAGWSNSHDGGSIPRALVQVMMQLNSLAGAPSLSDCVPWPTHLAAQMSACSAFSVLSSP